MSAPEPSGKLPDPPRGTLKTPPVFLERKSYLRRRLTDAARTLPVIGGVLILLPLLWTKGAEGVTTVSAFIYVFCIWALMIALAAVIARPLSRRNDD
ncbi:MAG: hypothetical protein AAF714_06585 [Pseudomonadota bacterium]